MWVACLRGLVGEVQLCCWLLMLWLILRYHLMEDKERIDLLSELLIVVKHLDIASSDVLFAARTRLTSSIIEGGEADQHTVMDTEDENVDERRKKSRHDQETVVQVNLPTFVATSCCSSSR